MPLQITLLKYLTECNLGSRRVLANAIREGRVQVNHVTAENFKQQIDPSVDQIIFDGAPVHSTQTTICLMLNKPVGVITTTNDEINRKTVLDLIPKQYRSLRLYPVGRLDKDSTGLLLLTNDGDLTYRLTHPKFEHEKEYLVAIAGSLTTSEKKKLEKGIRLEDGNTYPASVKVIRKNPPFNYSIIIHEGRKRQVRRMFEELGHPVLALHRIRMGKLRLGDLKEGHIRELSPNEIKDILVQRK